MVDGKITKVRLPKLVQGVPWGTTVTNISNPISAGLPNISGTVYAGNNYGGLGKGSSIGFHNTSGAFHLSENTYKQCVANGESGGLINSLEFDASKSNSIYGNSNTVQPPGIGVIWCIQYASVFDDDLNIPIMSISVDGVHQQPDANRNVDIKLPKTYDYSPDYNNIQLIADDFWYGGDGAYNSSNAYKINVPGYLYFDKLSQTNGSDYSAIVDSAIYVARNPNYFNGYYYRNRARTAIFYQDIDANYSNNARIFIMPGKDTWINVGTASSNAVALMFVPCKFVTSEYSKIRPEYYFIKQSFVPPPDDASFSTFVSSQNDYYSVGEDKDAVNAFWDNIASGSIYIDDNGNSSTTINTYIKKQTSVVYTNTLYHQDSSYSLMTGKTVPLYNLVKMKGFNPFAGDWKDNFDESYNFKDENIPDIVNQKDLP